MFSVSCVLPGILSLCAARSHVFRALQGGRNKTILTSPLVLCCGDTALSSPTKTIVRDVAGLLYVAEPDGATTYYTHHELLIGEKQTNTTDVHGKKNFRCEFDQSNGRYSIYNFHSFSDRYHRCREVGGDFGRFLLCVTTRNDRPPFLLFGWASEATFSQTAVSHLVAYTYLLL